MTPGDANNVRSEPTGDSALLGQIPGGGVFTVLQGPVCGDQRAWWQVDYNGLVGWTVEGAGDTYWVEPIVSVGSSSNRISAENLMHLTSRDPQFNNIRDAAWSADGRWFAVIDDDGLWLRDEQSGSDARLLVKRNQNGGIGSLFIRPAGDAIHYTMYTGQQNEHFIIDTQSGEQRLLTNIPTNFIRAFSPDGGTLAFNVNAQLVLWDVASQTTKTTIDLPYSPVHVIYSPDGRSIAVSGNYGSAVLLLDSTDGTILQTLQVESTPTQEDRIVLNIAFSPDSARLAAATHQEIILWDTLMGKRLAVLDGGYRVAFSPDGQLLVSTYRYTHYPLSFDDGIVWDANTGQQLAILQGHTDMIDGLFFSPDGATLITTQKYPRNTTNEQALLWTITEGSDSESVRLIDPPADGQCPSYLPVRLRVDTQARVLPNIDALQVRPQPTTSSVVSGELAGKTVVNVLDGPICDLGYVWWQVQTISRGGLQKLRLTVISLNLMASFRTHLSIRVIYKPS